MQKYSYLIHAPEAEYQVSNDGNNMFVFNTEAHPMKVCASTRQDGIFTQNSSLTSF